jgi:uncharacterized protein YmfQ (DUF2313 family)
MDVTAYKQQLVALSPVGHAWNTEQNSDYKKLLATFAEGLARLDKHTEKYLKELDLRTATDLLPEWERLLGLPDVCSPGNQTLQQRRESAHSKFIQKGGQSKKYFIELAGSLGYEITISVYKPFIAGISRCGQSLNPIDMRFVWRVNVPGNRAYKFRTGMSLTGERLLKVVPADQLECIFKQLQPSHTTLYFNYQ